MSTDILDLEVQEQRVAGLLKKFRAEKDEISSRLSFILENALQKAERARKSADIAAICTAYQNLKLIDGVNGVWDIQN